MRDKWKDLLVAVVLSIAFPAFIFSTVKGRLHKTPIIEKPVEQNLQETSEQSVITVSVHRSDGSIENLPMDDYLVGVVLREMPAEFEMEALKAQAVVARTYTLRRFAAGGKHADAIICTDPSCCQGYTDAADYIASGASMDSVKKVQAAVEATKDLVLIYDGELIEATYFSCSGGMTEDAAAVWGADIPYLQATKSPGEEIASHYTDTVTFTANQFQTCLGRRLQGKPETWLGAVTYTDGNGVKTMQINNKEYKGTELRQLFGLRSTAFTMRAVGDTITVTTKGFGHRVGMSQYGAEAMAISGSRFDQILAHYYAGVKLAAYKAVEIDKEIVLEYNIA